MKKAICLLLFILSLQGYVNGQTRAIDSLRKLLEAEKVDTNKIALLFNLSRAYSRFRPDTGLQLAQEALTLAKETGYVRGEVLALRGVGIAFQHAGNYPKALMFFFESLNKAEAINYQQGIARALTGIYVNYSERGDERQAVNYALQTVLINKKLHDDNALANDFVNLGDGYMILNKMDSAKWYNLEGNNLALRQNDLALIGYALHNFGNIYSKTGQDATALNYFRAALPYSMQSRDDENVCETYLGMSKIFERTNHHDSCLHYAKLSLVTAKQAGFTKAIMNACNFLTAYYASIHNTDSAFAFQSAAIAAKDSLFNEEKAKEVQALNLEEAMRQQQIKEAKIHFQNQIKLYTLLGGIFCLLITAVLLYRNNRHKQKANTLLARQKQKVEDTLEKLKSTEAQLIQSEKMASLGELTAGIAHEIQNPLNFVNNFSEVNKELISELVDEVDKGNTGEVKLIAADIRENSEKINIHGKRADAIVKGMLQHSRASAGQKEMVDINKLADEYLQLAYHGFRAKDKNFNAKLITEYDAAIDKIKIIPQDVGRVILNVINNAFYAVNQRQKTGGNDYEPTVTIRTTKSGGNIMINVMDNGTGISQKNLDKIFQPFFTTKPTGQGTGLGLSLAYDIIKAHGGEIKAETKEGEGSMFIIKLPAS